MDKMTKQDVPVTSGTDNTYINPLSSLSDEGEARRRLLEDVIGPPIVPFSEEKTAAGAGIEPAPGKGW